MTSPRAALPVLVAAFAIGIASAEDAVTPPRGGSVPAPAIETTPMETRPKSDEPLETTISRRLADDTRVNAMKVKIAVREGHVTLTGDAADIEEKEAAEAVVRRVPGVRDVENKLVIADHGEPAPGTSKIPELPRTAAAQVIAS